MSFHGYWVLTSDNRLLHFDGEVSEVAVELRSRPVAIAMTRDGQGCLVLDRSGYIAALGTARSLGDLSSLDLVAPPVDIVASPTSVGYWVIDSNGSVFSFGNAPFLEGVPQVTHHAVTAVKSSRLSMALVTGLLTAGVASIRSGLLLFMEPWLILVP